MSKPKHFRSLFAAALVLAIAASAHARSGGDCDEFGCGGNGIWETGVALDGVVLKNLHPDPSEPIVVAEERPGPIVQPRISCPSWGCGENGIWQNGVAWHGLQLDALDLQRVRIVLPAAK